MHSSNSVSDRPPHNASASSAFQEFDHFYQEQISVFLQRLSDYPGLPTLHKPFCEYLTRPGKQIRPRLLLAAHDAFCQGGKKSTTLLGPATGLELFHTFVLIHDDLIDQAATRRGKPALHRALVDALHCSPERGQSLALVLGDILFSFAVEQFSGLPLPPDVEKTLRERFLQMAAETGSGQAAELVASITSLKDVDEAMIEEIYYGKTTRYTFEVPLQMGALAASARPRFVEEITTWARPLGLAFQIENDLHEIRSIQEDSGALPIDFQAGMKTIFFKRFFSAEGAIYLDKWRQILAAPKTAASPQWKPIIAAMRESASFTDLAERVMTLFQRSRELIEASSIPHDTKRRLQKLVDTLLLFRHHSEADVSSKSGFSS